jgi:hypothetical protein
MALDKKNNKTNKMMKNKYLYIALGAMALATAACSDDDLGSSSPSRSVDAILSATVEGQTPNTRVGFSKPNTENKTAAFYWSKDDQIGVTTIPVLSDNTKGTESTTFSLLNIASGAGKGTGAFTGSLIGEVGNYSVYPYNVNHSYDGSTLTYYFPGSYSYTHLDADFYSSTGTDDGSINSFNAPMFAKVSNSSAEFKHLGGVFCVQIKNIPVTAGRFVFTANKQITGEYTSTTTTESSESLLVLNAKDATADSDNNEVVIDFTGATVGDPGVFFVPVPVGKGYNVGIRLQDADGGTNYVITSENNVDIARRNLYGIRVSEANVFEKGVVEATLNDVNEKLASNDKVVIDETLANNSSFSIPAGENAKTVIINNIADDASVAVTDGATEGFVPALTLSLPKAVTGLTVTMANSEIDLVGNNGETKIASLAVESASNVVLDNGVTVESLEVKKGNVYLKEGSTLSAVKNSTGATLYIIYEGDNAPSGLASTENNIKVIKSSDAEGASDLGAVDLVRAAAEGGTYTLTEDIDLNKLPASILNSDGRGFIVPADKEFTIDLNGKTLTGANKRAAYLYVLGKLTLKDSATGGKLVQDPSVADQYETGLIVADGAAAKLTVLSGSYKTEHSYLIALFDQADVAISGGKFESGKVCVGGNGTSDPSSIIDITGGEFIAGDYAFFLPHPGTTTISGASTTVTGNSGAICIHNGTLNIEGGTFTSLGTTDQSENITTKGDGTAGLKNGTIALTARYGATKVNITGGSFIAKGDATTLTPYDFNTDSLHQYKRELIVSNAEFTDLSAVTVYTTSKNYTGYSLSGSMKLSQNCSVNWLDAVGDRNITVDLDNHTVRVLGTSGYNSEVCLTDNTKTVQYKNGTINANDNTPEKGNYYCLFVRQGNFTFDNITFSTTWGTAIGMQGNYTEGKILNSNITAKYMAVGSNASLDENGESVYGYNATLYLTNSTFTATDNDGSGLVNNVPSTVYIDKCSFTGQCQGAFLRGGTYSIKKSKFTLNAVYSGSTLGDVPYGTDGNRTDGCRNDAAWGSGNAAPYAALVIGNKGDSYKYPTSVTFEGDQSTGTVTGKYKENFPAMYVYGASQTNGVTITGDYSGFVSSGYEQNIVAGGWVNGKNSTTVTGTGEETNK